MNEKEAIERINDLIDTCNKGIEMHPYDKELFNTDKKALQTVLQLLKQKDNKINKAIDKLKKHKHDLDYEPWSIYKVNGSILFDLVKILEE